MSRLRFAIFAMTALCFSIGTALADEGQFLILHARYGNEHNHVDVTNRLKELARADRPFVVNNESMGIDPIHGQRKMLRVFARGPDGEERSFDFPEGSIFNGAQFRSWGRADWGDEHWRGGWNGREDHAREDHDAGDFLILSAQYGNSNHLVDVTTQLKELARHDVSFRLDYRTFGVDPAEGHSKVLRIYARGPDGHERVFEFRDNTIVEGSQFRGWGRGEWGDHDRWSGRWEGEEQRHR
jgi:hypothetical protein